MQTGYQQVSHNYFKNLVRQLCRRLRLLNRGPNQEIVRRIVVGQYGARRPGLRARVRGPRSSSSGAPQTSP